MRKVLALVVSRLNDNDETVEGSERVLGFTLSEEVSEEILKILMKHGKPGSRTRVHGDHMSLYYPELAEKPKTEMIDKLLGEEDKLSSLVDF